MSEKTIKSTKEKYYQRNVLKDKSDTLKLTQAVEKSYNEKGNIIEQKTILYKSNKDSSITRTTYHYNENHLLSQVNVYTGASVPSENAVLKVSTSHTYDNAGLLEKTVISNVNNNMLESEEYEYSDNGKKVIKKTFTPGRTLKSKTVNFFDEKGNKVKMFRYDDSQLKDSTIYKYDSNNFEIYSANYSSEGQLKFKYVYENDSKGNQTRTKMYHTPEKDLVAYYVSDYVYDSNGNWTEATEKNYATDQIISKRFREIIYY